MFNQIKAFFVHDDKKLKSNQWIFGVMLVAGFLGLLASFVLSVEAIHLAKDPDAELICSVNVVLNCATVAKHPSAELLGFPNAFFGIIGYTAVMVIAALGLWRVKLPKSFMALAQIGFTLGLIFALWLFYTSMFVIQALCPWCLLITTATLFLFFTISRYNIRENNLYLPKKVQKSLATFIKKDYDKLTLGVLMALMIAGIFLKYGEGLFL